MSGLYTQPLLASLSTWHIVALCVLVLVLFGGKKLPELARGMARGMRIFRDELSGVQRDMEEPSAPKPTNQAPTPTEPGKNETK